MWEVWNQAGGLMGLCPRSEEGKGKEAGLPGTTHSDEIEKKQATRNAVSPKNHLYLAMEAPRSSQQQAPV